MAASEELFGEGYPGSLTNQPRPLRRQAELSEQAFPRETADGAHFTVRVGHEHATRRPSNLTPEEEFKMAQRALGRTTRSRAELEARFRKAGLDDLADGIGERTTGIIESEQERLERTRLALEQNDAA